MDDIYGRIAPSVSIAATEDIYATLLFVEPGNSGFYSYAGITNTSDTSDRNLTVHPFPYNFLVVREVEDDEIDNGYLTESQEAQLRKVGEYGRLKATESESFSCTFKLPQKQYPARYEFRTWFDDSDENHSYKNYGPASYLIVPPPQFTLETQYRAHAFSARDPETKRRSWSLAAPVERKARALSFRRLAASALSLRAPAALSQFSLSLRAPDELHERALSLNNPALYHALAQSPAAPLSCPPGPSAIFRYTGNDIPVGAIPAKPAAPLATGLHATTQDNGIVTLSLSQWPANTRLLQLLQDGAVIHEWAQTDQPRSHEVKGLQLFETYAFRLRGTNRDVIGDASDATTVEVVSPSLQVEWVRPATGDEIRGKTALVGRVGAEGHAVEMQLNGSALADVRRVRYEADGAQLWASRFDPLGLDFLGDVTLRLLAFDALGLPARADIVAYLSVTLAKATRYEHIAWADPQGRDIGKVALTAHLDDGDGWVDALVTAPGAGAIMPYADYDAMEEALRDWQNVALDEVFTLLSEAPTNKLEAILRLTPPRLETRYPLGATGATRVRRVDDEKLEVLTFEPSKVVEVTPDGVQVILDISARGFENVIDARRWREDKVVVVTQDEVWVCEKDESAADWRVVLRGESKPCIAVETLKDAFYLAFSDANGSRIWRHDGTDPTLAHETDEQIVLMRAMNDSLAWATANNQLWSWKAGTATMLYGHDAPIVDVLFGETGEVEAFADSSHVWRLKGEGENRRRVLVGEIAPDVRALGFYQGKNALPRLTAGGDAGPAIYSVASSGAWSGIWSLAHGATGIDGLGRFLTTHVEKEGDPLMGGKPAVTAEILVAVARVPNGGGYVAFIEEAKQTRDTSTRARGVKRLVVVHENKPEQSL